MNDSRQVLIVDDDPKNISRIEQALAALGCKSDSAGDGEQALATMSRLSGPHGFPGIVITDMKMPVMDGRSFHAQLKARDAKMAARMIFATGDTVSEDARAFLDSTGNPVVGKPFRLEEMEDVIEQLFGPETAAPATPAEDA